MILVSILTFSRVSVLVLVLGYCRNTIYSAKWQSAKWHKAMCDWVPSGPNSRWLRVQCDQGPSVTGCQVDWEPSEHIPCVTNVWLSAKFLRNRTEAVVKTQRNSTELILTQNNSKSNFVEVRHSSHLAPTTTTPPHTNFSVTSRPTRKLKFCTDTH